MKLKYPFYDGQEVIKRLKYRIVSSYMDTDLNYRIPVVVHKLGGEHTLWGWDILFDDIKPYNGEYD